jgi:hypothetical protein
MSQTQLRRSIVVTFQFEGFHCWPNAPEEFRYLGKVHRHMFHVRAVKEVKHNERDIEFIKFKREMEQYACDAFGTLQAGSETNYQATTYSCETMAEKLIEVFQLRSCQVMEDNENGALLEDVSITTPATTATAAAPIPPGSAVKMNDFGQLEAVVDSVTTEERSRFSGCFIGYEAEGPYFGMPTLFVPGWIDRVSLLDALQRAAHYKVTQRLAFFQIYFGADDSTGYSEELIAWLQSEWREWRKCNNGIFSHVTFEFDAATAGHLTKVTQATSPPVTLTVLRAKNEVAWRTYVGLPLKMTISFLKKVTGDKIIWASSTGLTLHETPTDHPFFAMDRPISEFPLPETATKKKVEVDEDWDDDSEE